MVVIMAVTAGPAPYHRRLMRALLVAGMGGAEGARHAEPRRRHGARARPRAGRAPRRGIGFAHGPPVLEGAAAAAFILIERHVPIRPGSGRAMAARSPGPGHVASAPAPDPTCSNRRTSSARPRLAECRTRR